MSALAFEAFLSTPEILEVFGERSIVQGMMDFEAALARAQAAEGLIPAGAAVAIAGVCKADLYDVPALIAASGRAGSLAIPLVKRLIETVALFDAEAARHVHFGSTSQDVIDTGLVLVTRRALALIEADLDVLVESLLDVAEHHVATPVLARTLMQPALVTSLGFKLLAWVEPLARARTRLRAAARQALQLQLGGAVGTLGVMGPAGAAVARRMAGALALRVPVGTWHTQRDEWVGLGCELGLLCGSLGKMARDLSLMSQGEIGELAEPAGPGRGGSSAMPHKRNPVGAMVALAAAQRAPQRVAGLLAAMPQEQERGLGNWQAELAEWAGLCISTHGAVRAMREVAAGLEVDAGRMRENIERLGGLVHAEALAVALAETIGKAGAHGLVERWSQQAVQSRRPLRAVAEAALAAGDVPGARPGRERLDAIFDLDLAAAPAAALARQRLLALRQERSAQAAGGDARDLDPLSTKDPR